jgi:hypothetical protein
LVFNWMYDIDDGGERKKLVKYNSVYTFIDKEKWRIPTKHIKKTDIRNIILLFYCEHVPQWPPHTPCMTSPSCKIIVNVRQCLLFSEIHITQERTIVTLIKPMLKKIANQNIVSNIYNVLIGWFYIWITRLKLTLDTFMTVRHVLS